MRIELYNEKKSLIDWKSGRETLRKKILTSKDNLLTREAAKERGRAEEEEEETEETEEGAESASDGSACVIAPTRGVDSHAPLGGQIGDKHDRRRRLRWRVGGWLRRGGVGRQSRYEKEGGIRYIYI